MAAIIHTLPFAFAWLMATAVSGQNNKPKTILFVCEHGSAKSIVAAAHFERIAAAQGIQMNVISRGTKPDEVIPDKINKILVSDGFTTENKKPTQLNSEDLRSADIVVAFTSIPSSYGNTTKIESWSIPSFESGYPAARDSIIQNIERLIQRIKTENKN